MKKTLFTTIIIALLSSCKKEETFTHGNYCNCEVITSQADYGYHSADFRLLLNCGSKKEVVYVSEKTYMESEVNSIISIGNCKE